MAAATTHINVHIIVLSDNLINQFHCPDIQFSELSYIAELRIKHFYSCPLSMHVLLFTPTPKLSVWQLPVKEKKKKSSRKTRLWPVNFLDACKTHISLSLSQADHTKNTTNNMVITN